MQQTKKVCRLIRWRAPKEVATVDRVRDREGEKTSPSRHFHISGDPVATRDARLYFPRAYSVLTRHREPVDDTFLNEPEKRENLDFRDSLPDGNIRSASSRLICFVLNFFQHSLLRNASILFQSLEYNAGIAGSFLRASVTFR